jgi:hypothetical protein
VSLTRSPPAAALRSAPARSCSNCSPPRRRTPQMSRPRNDQPGVRGDRGRRRHIPAATYRVSRRQPRPVNRSARDLGVNLTRGRKGLANPGSKSETAYTSAASTGSAAAKPASGIGYLPCGWWSRSSCSTQRELRDFVDDRPHCATGGAARHLAAVGMASRGARPRGQLVSAQLVRQSRGTDRGRRARRRRDGRRAAGVRTASGPAAHVRDEHQ